MTGIYLVIIKLFM